MNTVKPPRVRFAPAPTGMMHLGNVRTALLNFLFAKKKNGVFILRLEDTDPERNFDPGGKQIKEDLYWLGLHYNEGPEIGGPYAPYQQSERTHFYQKKLDELKEKGALYRCFCTPEELEKKRQRQIALKIPPRYDRTCLKLSQEILEKKLAEEMAFIWRFQVPDTTIVINEMSRGKMNFEGKNFSDFPVTRSDGTFTFIFANAVDDMLMNITNVLRGEDHLSNTVNQVLLIEAMGGNQPKYWHLPILCNVDGKKLSKRDFGFALLDLKKAGYLPEAITNYLAILGGSFENELMSIDELIQTMDFDTISTTGNIKYDPDKLKWFNHKYLQRYDPKKLAQLVKPILVEHYKAAEKLDNATIGKLIQAVKSEMYTLNDAVPALNFYFNKPILTREIILEHIPDQVEVTLFTILRDNLNAIAEIDQFLNQLKKAAKAEAISNKILFQSLRLILTGNIEGPSIHDIISIVGPEESKERIKYVIH